MSQIVEYFLSDKHNVKEFEIVHTDYELFQKLVLTILSQNASDKYNRDVAFKRLSETIEITPEDILAISDKVLQNAIFSSGSYIKKTEYLKAAAEYVRKNGFPRTRDELMRIHGVGKKTADVVMAHLGEQTFPVDTNLFRLAERLGISDRGNYDLTQQRLRELFPREKWNRAHSVMIWFARIYCKAVNPRCSQCVLYLECKSKGAW